MNHFAVLIQLCKSTIILFFKKAIFVLDNCKVTNMEIPHTRHLVSSNDKILQIQEIDIDIIHWSSRFHQFYTYSLCIYLQATLPCLDLCDHHWSRYKTIPSHCSPSCYTFIVIVASLFSPWQLSTCFP